jgi:predicted aconitase with swiveling domain
MCSFRTVGRGLAESGTVGRMMRELQARVLIDGSAKGRALVLSGPLSLWGGLDPKDGRIIDPRHAEHGAVVTDRVLVLPYGRGSSSASSILLEAVRLGTGPAAILTREIDGILALGAAVAREMYGACPPVLVLETAEYDQLIDGALVEIEAGGALRLSNDPG